MSIRLMLRLNSELRHHPWWEEFERNCPGWNAAFALIPRDEIIDWTTKLIWMSATLPDPWFRWAHGTAHVMRHPEGMRGRIDEAEEIAADEIAMMWSSYAPVEYTVVQQYDVDVEVVTRARPCS